MSEINTCCQWRHPKFEYLEAGSVDEACSLLSKYKDTARLIAGGTEVLVLARKGKISPQYVINIKSIPDLADIEYGEDGLRIGALSTLSDIESSPVVKEKFPVIAYSAGLIGSQQVRNTGTIGGNLCNAAPFGDMAPSLIGLGARVKLKGVSAERTILLEDFIEGPGKSAIKEDEMMLEVHVPNPLPNTYTFYRKLPARTSIDIAVVSVAAVVVLDPKDNHISDAKIVLGAVSPTPVRAHRAENILKGEIFNEELIEKAAEAAVEETRPISDLRASNGYRKEMVKVLTAQALKELMISVL